MRYALKSCAKLVHFFRNGLHLQIVLFNLVQSFKDLLLKFSSIGTALLLENLGHRGGSLELVLKFKICPPQIFDDLTMAITHVSYRFLKASNLLRNFMICKRAALPDSSE